MTSVTRSGWDVFVSYAWVDDEPQINDVRWVERFTDTLIASLDVRAGRKDMVRVFRDTQMHRTKRVSESLEQAVQTSGVLLALLSPGFLQSVNCQRELSLFKLQRRAVADSSHQRAISA